MNLKNIRELRNDEIAAAKNIVSGAKAEHRSLNTDETVDLTNHYNKAKDLTNQIAKRSKSNLNGAMVTETRGAKVMNKDKNAKVEVRALNSYLHTGSTKELRDLDATETVGNAAENTAGNGGVTVPHAVDSQVITKLSEDAPVVNAVRHIPSVTGTLTLVKEGNTDEAGFVGETKSVPKMGESLKTVKLDEHRAGAYVELTNELMEDSAVNLVNYAVNRLSWSFSKALERSILLGTDHTGAKSFTSGIINDSDVKAKNKTFSGALTVDNMLDLYDAINPEYLKNAIMVASRPAFDAMTKLKDGNGQYLIFRDNSSDTPGVLKFKGIPVYVSDTLNNSKTNVVLGDFNQGYGLMIKQGMNITHVTQDTTQALNGGHLIVLSANMDGAVINPDAFITANCPTTAAPSGGSSK